MPQIFHHSTNVLSRLSIVAVLLAVPAVAAVIYYAELTYGRQLQVPIEQPVEFSHLHHVTDDGIDCRYCHTSVDKAAFAGIPDTHTCMTCHSQLWTDSPLLEPVVDSFLEDRPIEWVRVHNLPDFAYFNHSIHISKGVACASCHGPVDEMALTWQHEPMTMAWCVDCHRNPEPRLVPLAEVYRARDRPAGNGGANNRSGEQLAYDHHLLTEFQLTNCSTCHR